MDNRKNAKIRRIYGIAFLVLTALLGLAFILQALNLHYGGGYTEDGVRKKLTEMILPSVAWVACLIVGVALFALLPVPKEKAKGQVNLAAQLEKLSSRLPSGEWAEKKAALKKKSIALWSACGGLIAISFVFPLAYLLNPKNFNYTDTNTEMAEAVLHTLPFVAVAFAAVIVAYLLQQSFLRAAIAELKTLIASAARAGTLQKPELSQKGLQEGLLDNPKILWATRGVLIAAAIVLIIFGALNGGLENVLFKAANLCMECVGLA